MSEGFSIFGDLDIAGAEDNPFAIPNNTYAAVVSDVEVKRSAKGGLGMFITYTISEGEHSGKKVSEYKSLPVADTPKDKADQWLSFVKMRFNSLGIPEERMNSLERDDFIGIEVFVTTKMDGDFAKPAKVVRQDDAE